MTKINYELTDTYAGEANYNWCKRGTVEQSDCNRDVVRRVKKELGWTGLRCKTEHNGDMITLRPQGMLQICFITFEY